MAKYENQKKMEQHLKMLKEIIMKELYFQENAPSKLKKNGEKIRNGKNPLHK